MTLEIASIVKDFYNPYHGFERYGNHVVPPDPYALYFETPSGLLTVVSVTHSYDPNSPAIGQICTAWKTHLANTAPENRESLCEGNPSPLPKLDLTSLVEWGNERALQLALAEKENTPVRSADTDNKTEFAAVLATGIVEPAAILYYATLRHTTHLPFGTQAQGRLTLLHQALERYKTYLPDDQRQLSQVSFEELHQYFFNRPFAHDLYDPLFPFDQTVSFWLNDTEIQKVAIIWNDYRDTQQIIPRIQESVDYGKEPFVVLGWQHIERLKSKLQEIGNMIPANSLRPGSHLPIPGLVSLYNFNPFDRPWEY